MSFDVEKARSEADWFLEYPDEEDKRTVKFAMMMRAACNRIEALEAENARLRAGLIMPPDWHPPKPSVDWMLGGEKLRAENTKLRERLLLAEAEDARLRWQASEDIRRLEERICKFRVDISAVVAENTQLRAERDRLAADMIPTNGALAIVKAENAQLRERLRLAEDACQELVKSEVWEALRRLSWEGSSINYPVRTAMQRLAAWRAACGRGE